MLRTALLATLVALCAAAPVAASTASAENGTLTLIGGGDPNGFTVERAGDGYEVRDSRAALVAGPGCRPAAGGAVRCDGGVGEMFADLGDGDDTLAIDLAITLAGRLYGGNGNDRIDGGAGGEQLFGGPGDDRLHGRRGPDTVDGEDGNDRVYGGARPDVVRGAEGDDRLYGGSSHDNLDGQGGNDRLHGGTGHDLLTGGDGDDVFTGGRRRDGSDTMHGGLGLDRVDYTARQRGVVADADGRADDGVRDGGSLSFTDPLPSPADTGSPEDDNAMPDVERIRGSAFDDVLGAPAAGGRLDGRGGTDALLGAEGPDQLYGGSGFDRIASRGGGTDRVVCGGAVDRAFADGEDAVADSCEDVFERFAIAVEPLARTLTPDGKLNVEVTCPAQAAVRCVGAVHARTVRRFRRGGKRRTMRLGGRRLNLQPGQRAQLDIQVSLRGRRVLRRLRRTRVRVVTRGRDEAGRARPDVARLILAG